MKSILATRLMHWKKNWVSITFWLCFPLIATTFIMFMFGHVVEDSRIPVGIVVKDDSSEAADLLKHIRSTDFLSVTELEQSDAEDRLKKHQLDSVFVINNHYSENLQQNSRNGLLTSYKSDQSVAYTPVKEMVVSYIQQETGRFKAVSTIKELANHYHQDVDWTKKDIIAKSIDIQSKQNLLKTSFTFGSAKTITTDAVPPINHWRLWACFSLLATFLLFDWVIKERQKNIRPRFVQMRYSQKQYLFRNLILYTVAGLIFDFITFGVFALIFHEPISIMTILIFRLSINILAFLFAHLFKRFFVYNMTAFALTLVLAIGSGALIPISGLGDMWQWIRQLNPLYPLINGNQVNLATLILLVLLLLWSFKKGKFDVTR